MKEALLSTLSVVGWLGIILGMLLIINTVCGVMYNTNEKQENFSFRKLFKGILKAILFYGCCALLATAFTMLPFVNQMIVDIFGIQLIAPDVLTTLSTTAVLGTIIAAVIAQGKKALEGIMNLLNVSSNVEEITWEVEEEPEEVEYNK